MDTSWMTGGRKSQVKVEGEQKDSPLVVEEQAVSLSEVPIEEPVVPKESEVAVEAPSSESTLLREVCVVSELSQSLNAGERFNILYEKLNPAASAPIRRGPVWELLSTVNARLLPGNVRRVNLGIRFSCSDGIYLLAETHPSIVAMVGIIIPSIVVPNGKDLIVCLVHIGEEPAEIKCGAPLVIIRPVKTLQVNWEMLLAPVKLKRVLNTREEAFIAEIAKFVMVQRNEQIESVLGYAEVLTDGDGRISVEYKAKALEELKEPISGEHRINVLAQRISGVDSFSRWVTVTSTFMFKEGKVVSEIFRSMK